MGKRGNNEGSIRKKGKRWEARYTLNGQQKSIYGDTRAEAAGQLASVLRDLHRGLPISAERMTVRDYFTSWLDTHKVETRESTWVGYEAHCRRHILPALGRIPLAKLTAHDLNALYAAKLKDGKLSPTTVNSIHRTIHKALQDAVRTDLVPRNVADLAAPPRKAEFTATPYSPEQAQAFLVAIQGDRFEALYVLSILTGMRESELLSLTWDALNLETGMMDVRTTHRRIRGHWVINNPKTRAGRRQIPLNPAVVASLRRHRTRQLEERVKLGPAWTENNLVFPREDGTRLVGSLFYMHRYLPLLRRHGLPEIRFHDLRHTVATLLMSLGIQTPVVSEMLGHSSVQITMDLYQHVTPTMQREASAALGRLLGMDTEDGTH